jgi:hypothetical protein
MPDYRHLETQLNDFNPQLRKAALVDLLRLAEEGSISFPAEVDAFNLHCHTFFSFNAYGYSPTALAWLAKAVGE